MPACFKFVLPNSLNVSDRLVNERIPLTHVLGCEAVSGRGGGGGGVMWPGIIWLGLA